MKKSCFPQRHKHLIIAGQHFLACLRVYLAHDCESKHCAEMLTKEGLKKAVGWMTRGLCEETGEIKPALNDVFFRGGACVLMYLAVMGEDGKGPSYSAGSGFIKRCKQISAGPGVTHTHIRLHIHTNMAKANDSHTHTSHTLSLTQTLWAGHNGRPQSESGFSVSLV